MLIKSLFISHPSSVGETYLEHQRVALSFGIRMVLTGLACLVHAIFPFLFATTGSREIRLLHDRMVTSRIRPGAGDASPPDARAKQ